MRGESHAQTLDLARDRAWLAEALARASGEQRLVEVKDARLQTHGLEAQVAQARRQFLEQFWRAGYLLAGQPDPVLFRAACAIVISAR